MNAAELKALSEAPAAWSCKAGSLFYPLGECGWPLCGCDPHANKVIETLNESGFYIVPGEANAEMEEAGREYARTHDPSTFAGIFRAMVERSQKP